MKRAVLLIAVALMLCGQFGYRARGQRPPDDRLATPEEIRSKLHQYAISRHFVDPQPTHIVLLEESQPVLCAQTSSADRVVQPGCGVSFSRPELMASVLRP